MIKLLNKIGIIGLISVARLISAIPQPVLRRIGSALGTLAYYVMVSRRRVGLVNLHLCFPEQPLAQRQQVLKAHFRELFIISLSYGLIFGASARRLKRLVHYRNLHYLTEHYEKRPVVLMAPHFLGLDIGANRTSIEITGYSMFSQQRNQYLSQRVKAARLRFMQARGGEIFSRQEGLRTIVKKMKQHNWPFYYLPDQDMDARSSVFVPFFAHPSCATLDTLPKLCKLAGAIVIPMATYREGNQYVVEFFPPWENFPSDDVIADVTRMNRYIEEMILRHPAQYLWLHKRFKTQPNLPRGKLYENC
jgi:KDO2-lipid IV(A) lauroyltransferase